ncbi:uncharacterized protein LOC141623452 isoform X1 [Silene latifolia]|uniref:uncharacterized protein LOC141623452 isoform X1 n=1 Tax=Silene latifolia TaxID=37657 RepID=UPI003D773E3A
MEEDTLPADYCHLLREPTGSPIFMLTVSILHMSCFVVCSMTRSLSRTGTHGNQLSLFKLEIRVWVEEAKEIDFRKDEITKLQMGQMTSYCWSSHAYMYVIYSLEQKALLENKSLRRQVAKLQGFVTPTEKSEEMYLEYYPIKRKVSPNKVAALASGEFKKEDTDSST